MKLSKPSMSFSELVYAINNRGKSMSMKEAKILSAPVAEIEVLEENDHCSFAQNMMTEISVAKTNKYMDKAENDLDNKLSMGKGDSRKANNRSKGLNTALDKLTKRSPAKVKATE